MPRLPSLSREKILAAAIQLVDAHGLGALSMRRLGQELGVEAMTLYRYVKNKADLLDGIHGQILAEMETAPAPRPWIEGLRFLADAFRAVLRAHPHALPLFATRPAVARNALAHVEKVLGILEEAGFSDEDCVYALHALASYVVGISLSQFGPQDDATKVPYGRLSAKEFPRLKRLGPQMPRANQQAEFEFGLDALLRGLAARLRAQRRRS